MNKKLCVLATFMTLGLSAFSQNVGIGKTNPTEKLDVNGNINVSGGLVVNGNAGEANQVLMKNDANVFTWGDISEFKNLVTYDCNGVAASPGASNCATNFIVPAGVTKIYVECWGGGGGGNITTGGSGGGYIAAKLDVVPGNSATLTIGAGGQYGTPVAAGTVGGNTILVLNGVTLTANGGLGGFFGDMLGNLSIYPPVGGGFSATGITSQYIGYTGQPGGVSYLNYIQASSTEFMKIIQYGDGGDAALSSNSGAKGGHRLIGNSLTQSFYGVNKPSGPGGGGSADANNGYSGRGGRIVIHW